MIARTTSEPAAEQVSGDAPRSWGRRTVLATSGAALLACAACASKSVGVPASSTATGASSAAGAAGTAGAAGKTPIASVSDIPADSGFIADAPSGQVILAKQDGKVVAHTAVCTHQGGIIDGAGVCPLHGSRFNPATGAVLNGPATQPLAAVAVTESGGKIYPG